ncbi:D-alanyl-D-alanine carboxypeptidase/D-alanyl-D-alanine-endopeptidase [Albirhodobacter sp. R86504]|uniref:D-alanyl-D-alanine carboxypeptidase/D-alanyl-D-alanine endopeptidase n=1 Tax=Albirhodobacter sp. R86504 TaxID=3093848 RepID=UPI00366CEED6
MTKELGSTAFGLGEIGCCAKVSRRALLGQAALGGVAFAIGATGRATPVKAQGLLPADLVAAAQLGGQVSYAVADLKTGQVLETMNADLGMAPASTMKALTTCYAFSTLGTSYRFVTRLVATGPIAGGVLNGDLILMGGGDPTLSTDGLAILAGKLADLGVTRISGRFLTYGGALPFREEIADDQPVYVGYNPAVSGLILNYNRVHFEWKRGQGGYQLAMDARGSRERPRAYTVTAGLSNREKPVYTYAQTGGKEQWTVSARALGSGGSRWLPVRAPDAYAGDVFQTLARARGVDLPNPADLRGTPRGQVIADLTSEPLSEIARDMLRYSTNITAEAVGMTASAQLGVAGGGSASGRAMSSWLKQTAGLKSAKLEDHSGLGVNSRISALDMVRALTAHGPAIGLRGVMRDFGMRDAQGGVIKGHPLQVQAKTGTLNFVSTLAGYMTAQDGTELVFAVFTGDLQRRARAKDQETPEGSGAWVRRSKILQSRLIERWDGLYGR